MKKKIISWCDKTMEWSLYVLIFALPFSKAIVSICAVLSIILWVVKRLFGYRTDGFLRMIPQTPLNQPLALFVFINALSVIFSTDQFASLEAFFTKTLKFAMIFLVTTETIKREKRVGRVLWTIMFSAVLMAADAGVQYFFGSDLIKGYERSRLSASFSAPNGFGAWLVIVIFFLWGALFMKGDQFFSRRGRIVLKILLPLLFVCLVMTYTRGAWLGFLFSLGTMLLIFLLRQSKKNKMKSVLGIIVCLGILLVSWPMIKNIELLSHLKGSGSTETIGQRISSKRSWEIRENLWEDSLLIIKDFPVFGCGLNMYSKTAPNYKRTQSGGIYPHNSYLQMAAETGLFGLLTFLWILSRFFHAVYQHLKRKKDWLMAGLCAGILGFLIHAFFDTHFYALQLAFLFWFTLGFAMALISMDQRGLQSPSGDNGGS